jgi:DNA-binding XRE family transcriptional regulator
MAKRCGGEAKTPLGKYRRELNISQQNVAEKSHLSLRSYQLIEQGKTKKMFFETARVICDAINEFRRGCDLQGLSLEQLWIEETR